MLPIGGRDTSADGLGLEIAMNFSGLAFAHENYVAVN
jgi:hypothetical protein